MRAIERMSAKFDERDFDKNKMRGQRVQKRSVYRQGDGFVTAVCDSACFPVFCRMAETSRSNFAVCSAAVFLEASEQESVCPAFRGGFFFQPGVLADTGSCGVYLGFVQRYRGLFFSEHRLLCAQSRVPGPGEPVLACVF